MMRWALMLALCAGPSLAQDAAPDTSPRPQSPPADAAADSDAADTSDDLPEDADPPQDTADTTSERDGMRGQLAESDADHATCLAALDELGVAYEDVDPIVPADDADCGILRPVSITEIAPGVAVAPSPTLRCGTARAMAQWTRDFVLPAAGRLTDRGALDTIQTGPGYTCRRRNNAPDGKLSEHSFGNAIDVLGFRFTEGPAIAVEPREADGTLAEAFQDAVRASACLDFATVLGPGSNAAHDDHLHLDVIQRSSGYRLCEQGGGTPD